MNWISWLLILLCLIIILRVLFLFRKTSSSKKHTIQLAERPPKGQNNPRQLDLVLFLFLFLLTVALAVQLLLGRLQ